MRDTANKMKKKGGIGSGMKYETSVNLHTVGFSFFLITAFLASIIGIVNSLYFVGVLFFGDAAYAKHSENLWWGIGGIGVGIAAAVAAFFMAAWLFENTDLD